MGAAWRHLFSRLVVRLLIVPPVVAALRYVSLWWTFRIVERMEIDAEEDAQEASAALTAATKDRYERELRQLAADEGWSQKDIEDAVSRYGNESSPSWVLWFTCSVAITLLAAVAGGMLRPVIL